MEEIIIEIDDEGAVEVKTRGFKGKGCLAASKWLEEQLGSTLDTKRTSEFYLEEETARVRIHSDSGN